MVSGLGLSPFKALETKPVSKPTERKFSEGSSLSSSENKAKDNSPLNSSSEASAKPLEKKTENKNSDFSKKLSEYSKDPQESKDSKESVKENDDSSTLHKKIAVKKESVKSEDGKETASSNGNVLDYPQMQMLNVPNQYQAPALKIEDDSAVSAVEAKPLNIDIQKLPPEAQPVAKFLQSMNEYFGIKPEKIMRALNQLPADVMLKSPHEAMTPLFEKLELQPRDFTKAQIFFTEMVQDLEKVTTQSPMMGQMPMAAPMPMATPAQKVATKKSTLDALIEQKISRKAIDPQNYMSKDNNSTNMAVGGGLSASPTLAQQPQANAAANLSQIFHVDPMAAQQSGLAIDKLQEIDPQLRIQDVKVNPDKLTDQFFVEGQDTASQLQMQKMLKGQTNEKDKEELKDELKNKLGERNPALSPQDLKQLDQFSQSLNTKLEGTLAAQVPTQVRNENINKITENAQTLITKGGGEMKIQLRPEGMGDVLLKVKVQDGQVGIQMTTDSHEAKKLLETGLNDLKLNLAEHKLSLNHMKVDVAAQTDNNNMNNFNNQDMRREEARDFLSQFRDYNESTRQQLGTASNVKAYIKPGTPNAPEMSTSSARRSRGGDGRLHLVA